MKKFAYQATQKFSDSEHLWNGIIYYYEKKDRLQSA